MTENVDFARLVILIRRATSLSPLPQSAVKLIRAIDTGEASAHDLERIIASDPALTTSLLRVSAEQGPSYQTPTLRHMIMRLGQRTVRAMGVSLAMKEVMGDVTPAKNFDAYRFARHSLVVGFLARFVYARRQIIAPFESSWSADELFSAGVLHDLGIGLVARVAPEVYERVFYFAKRTHRSVNQSFFEVYGCYPSLLGAEAAASWQLPPFFHQTQSALYAPWQAEDEYTAQCCLSYANYLSESFGECLATWEVEPQPVVEAIEEVGLEASEIESLREKLLLQVEDYMAPSTLGEPHVA